MWVEALKSGNYKQTTEDLFDPNEGYCCLGVLTDLYLREKEGSVTNMSVDVYFDKITDLSEHNNNTMPNMEIKQWANLTNNDCGNLAGMNDNGDSFETIAKFIEEIY